MSQADDFDYCDSLVQTKIIDCIKQHFNIYNMDLHIPKLTIVDYRYDDKYNMIIKFSDGSESIV